MKRGVLLLILAAGALSLLFGILMPVMYFTLKHRLDQARANARNASLQAPVPIPGSPPNPAGPRASGRYRANVATAQALLTRDPFRARALLVDPVRCPPELHEFGWEWAMQQLPQGSGQLFKENCHAAGFSADGRFLAVSTNEQTPTIVVLDLKADRSVFQVIDPSRVFALSPTGHRLAVYGGGKVLLCDVTDPSLPPRKLAAAGRVLGFTPDGKTLLNAGIGPEGHWIRWRVDTGEEEGRFPCSGDVVHLTADRATLVAVTFTDPNVAGSVTRYDTATGRVVQHVALDLAPSPWPNLDDKAQLHALTADGSALATVRVTEDQERLEVWDLTTGARRWSVPLPPLGHEVWALQLAFAPDGQTLASQGIDGEVHLWNAVDGTPLARFPGISGGQPEFLLWEPGGKALVADTMQGPSRWVPGIPASRLVWTTPRPTEGPCALSSDGRLLAGLSRGGAVQLWDVARQQAGVRVPATEAKVVRLEIAPNGKLVALEHADHVVRLVDTGTGMVVAQLPAQPKEWVALVFSANGTTLTTLDAEGMVRVWDCSTGVEQQHAGPYAGAALSPDGRVAHLENGGSMVVVTDLKDGTEVAHFEELASFTQLTFARNLTVLVGIDGQGQFGSWDLKAQTRLLSASVAPGAPDPPPAGPMRVPVPDAVERWAVSADGRTLASLSERGLVRIVDGQTGKPRLPPVRSLATKYPDLVVVEDQGRFRGLVTGNRVERFELSCDGRLLLIVGREGPQERPFCQILDTQSGDEVSPVPLPPGSLQDVFFSADGSTFAACRPAGTVTVWRSRP